MVNEAIAQALLMKVVKDTEYSPYFQIMSKYKYDEYKQFSTGMRFVERLAIWLNQFKRIEERKTCLEFIKNKLIYISQRELAHLVATSFPDNIDKILINKAAIELNLPEYKIQKIVNSVNYKLLRRKSLFLGLSDGARTEIFRRSNASSLTHEQIYLTYELSDDRISKMQNELENDIISIIGKNKTKEKIAFKNLFLLDDFSASGRSYIRYDKKEKIFKGKVSSLYYALNEPKLKKILNLETLNVYIVLYLCSEQAYDYLHKETKKLWNNKYKLPEIIPVYTFNNNIKLVENEVNKEILGICNSNDYYDKDIEDKHTGENIKLGYSQCALPLVLDHNTPNNSISILWSYDEAKFRGLFPRVPRHKEL